MEKNEIKHVSIFDVYASGAPAQVLAEFVLDIISDIGVPENYPNDADIASINVRKIWPFIELAIQYLTNVLDSTGNADATRLSIVELSNFFENQCIDDKNPTVTDYMMSYKISNDNNDDKNVNQCCDYLDHTHDFDELLVRFSKFVNCLPQTRK